MGYGLDITSRLSLLAAVSRKGSRWRLRQAVLLPGFEADPTEKPSAAATAPLADAWHTLRSLGVRANGAATSVPGRDVYYRFAPSSTNPRVIEAQVRMEADEIAGEAGKVLADYIPGADFDFAPSIHVALAREEIIDHYAGSLLAAGVRTGPLMPGCAALLAVWLASGDTDFDGVQLIAHIGEDGTDVILVREKTLLFARGVGMGVRDFIATLTPEFGGDEDSIRRILFTQIDLRPSVAADNLTGNRGIEAGQEVGSRLTQQIFSTLLLAKGAMKAPQLDARRVWLCGPGAAIPGLRELMMNRVRKTVEIFNPLAGLDLDGLDAQSAEIAESYRPALALAVGLALLQSDPSLERAEFLSTSLRKRRAFLGHSSFLYLAAAVIVAVLLPLYVATRAATIQAEADHQRLRQGPLGSYAAASSEIPQLDAQLQRARQRALASVRAVAPGRVATDVLVAFAAARPDSVRLKAADLTTDTANPSRDQSFQATTRLRLEFFIERLPGADPHQVNDRLRDSLKALPGVRDVLPGLTAESRQGEGLEVAHTLVLITDRLEGAP
jgi:Tfp pilus assembly PilM family ATPase